jgi:hypothetical protein
MLSSLLSLGKFWFSDLRIVPLPRNDMSDPARRLGVIAHVPGNQMHVEMENCLPCGSADVDPDVETIR